VDVWKDTTLGDSNVTEKLVQLLIVPDGQLQVTWDDTGLLVVTGGVTSQLENLGGKVLKNSSEVHWGTSTNTLSVVSLPQKTVNTTDWESETSFSRAALGSLSAACLSTGRFSSRRHFNVVCVV